MNRIDIDQDLYGRLIFDAIRQSYYDRNNNILSIINDTKNQISLYYKNCISNFLQDQVDILDSINREIDPDYKSLIIGIYDKSDKFSSVDISTFDSFVEFTYYYNLAYDDAVEFSDFEEFMTKTINNSFIVNDIIDFTEIVTRGFEYYSKSNSNRVHRLEYYLIINSYKKQFTADQARRISNIVYNFKTYSDQRIFSDLIDDLNEMNNLWMESNNHKVWYHA